MSEYLLKYQKHIWIVLAFKVALLLLLPLTGDEAYFIKWGQSFEWGYYDHPPMVGWVIYFLSFISDSHIFFRFFSFTVTLIVAYLMYKILLEFEESKERASFVVTLFLLMPIDILMILLTNDIPLVLFGTLGAYFLLLSLKRESLGHALLSGIFLGLSFLSKYFALFLMLGLLLFALIGYGKKAIKNILLIVVIIALFVAQNLYFNYNCCWNNIMFNFFARTSNLSYNFSTLFGYLGILVYLLTPWGLYFLVKGKYENKKLLQFIFSIVVVGLSIFLLVSLKKKIGLHWLLLFMPYMVMFFIFIEEEYQEKMLRYTRNFSYVHIAILMTVLLLPISLFESHKKYSDVVLFTQTQKVCQALKAYEPLFTTGYTSASVLSYQCDREIKMILNNSKYGRLDDRLLDIRTLKGKSIYIFDKRKPKLEKIKKVFGKIEVTTFEELGATFYMVKCQAFNYENYKKIYLDVQKEKFYRIPDWLPIGKCYFFDRYYHE